MDKTLPCRYCPDEFPNAYRRTRHLATAHPEHRNKVTRGGMDRLITPARGPRPGGSLKKPTDIYPARP